MDAPASETRLDELREQAWKDSVVAGKGVDVAGGPIPRKPGYYGEPVVKPPVWTWEIPLYFFFGGIGGMSAVIAFGAFLFHHVDLARAAMWIAAIAGAVLSPILLIMDLGRPHLFLNMLRVFKHRSPMSMGAWILTAFGTCTVPGLIALELHAHQIFPGTLNQLLSFAAGIFIFGAAIFGALLATYTGVLIGATAIPAWFLHRTLLPIHFGTAGLGSAAAVLELFGHRISALNFLGFYAAAVETVLLIWLSVDKHGVGRSRYSRTRVRLAHSHRRSVERSTCAHPAVFRSGSVRSDFIFNRRAGQPRRLDRGGQGFRLRSGIRLRRGTLLAMVRFCSRRLASEGGPASDPSVVSENLTDAS